MDIEDVGTEQAVALRRTARGRADLYLVLIALEQAVARPAGGREEDWLAGVAGAADDLVAAVEEHVAITEGASGLYEQIATSAPRLVNALDRLSHEHVEMRARALALRESARAAGSPAALREEVASLLGLLVRHRQQGSDLVWAAYGLDIGGVE